MKLFLPLLVLVAAPAFAQSPVAASQPSLPNAPASESKTPTIQARSNLVVLDVVVTDKNHAPVHNLRASDFHLREAGTDQAIKTFEEHTPSTAVVAPALPTLPPGVFANFSATPNDGAVNILLIDRLNTPFKDQPYLRDQLIAFLRKRKLGTQLAIFGLNTQLVYLQGFTADPALLLAALESKKNNARQSSLLDSPTDPSLAENLSSIKPTGSGSGQTSTEIAQQFAAVVADVKQFEAQVQSDQTQLRVRYTLEGMNSLARYLSGIPGRKNLLWFSGSFPISILPDGDLQDPFAIAADMQEQFRATTNLLSRSQVAVYPIDARGLQSAPVFDSAQSGSKYVNSPTALSKDLANFSARTADEQSTMRQMAFETGGQAYMNTNGLAEAVAKAIDQGSTYYTLTYTPTNPKLDGSFRKIQLSTPRPATELAYRRGYFADPPNGSPRKPLTANSAAPTALPTMQSAMLRGAPLPTQILLKALVVPAGPPTDETVTTNNQPTPAAKGPFRKYLVDYVVAPQDVNLKLTSPGRYDIAIQFVVIVYDSSGAPINSIGQTIHANLDLAAIQDIRKAGLQYHQVVSVPAKGEFFLRLAVHDLLVDHIGAIEVPVDAVRNLAEVTPPPPRKPVDPSRVPPTLNNLPR